MTARDRWEVELKCPVCGKTGTAEVSQADGWAFKNDQSTRVDDTPEGFDYEFKDGRPRFFCKEHGTPGG
ncbi:hypothetical protein U8P73_15045 [Rhizobium beringeri]|uniref:hypothetical protein n=1 Tax=Rhizobium TaxID=379 RepID=UPI0011471638|nr:MULTISPECIES: hypothetical protein [Rhizobium]WSG87367.1 hypothetical protein U8P73_15045 [Rhizobium beringeri]